MDKGRVPSVPDEFLEPTKFDPSDPDQQRKAKEEAFLKYANMVVENPFGGPPSFRDSLKDRETSLSPVSPVKATKDSGSFSHGQFWFIPSEPDEDHPAFRGSVDDPFVDGADYHRHITSPAKHKRAHSQPESPTGSSAVFGNNDKLPSKLTKSYSDNNVLQGQQQFTPVHGSLRGRRNPSAFHLSVDTSILGMERLHTIKEQEEYAKNYKVEVKDALDSNVRVVRSPMKRLFGEGGLLGRSVSSKDIPESQPKKTGLANWRMKVKQHVEDMGKELSEKLSAVEIGSRASRPNSGPSNFPVTLSPYVQGDVYMQLELLLNIETNNFLMHEFHRSRISLSSVKTVVEAWKNKGRPQVLGFRFDLCTQRELVGLNIDTLHFAGVNAFNRGKVYGVLASWRVLAKEIAVRTFCQPDSAVKKHFHDAERILELVDASPDSMLAFQELRGRVVSEIYREEKLDRERKTSNGVTRSWSPTKDRN